MAKVAYTKGQDYGDGPMVRSIRRSRMGLPSVGNHSRQPMDRVTSTSRILQGPKPDIEDAAASASM